MPVASEPRSGRWALVLGGAGSLVAIAALVLGTVNVIQDEGKNVVAMSGTELEAAARRGGLRPYRGRVVDPPRCHRSSPAPDGSYYEGWVWSDDGEGVRHRHLPSQR